MLIGQIEVSSLVLKEAADQAERMPMSNPAALANRLNADGVMPESVADQVAIQVTQSQKTLSPSPSPRRGGRLNITI